MRALWSGICSPSGKGKPWALIRGPADKTLANFLTAFGGKTLDMTDLPKIGPTRSTSVTIGRRSKISLLMTELPSLEVEFIARES